ncbi:AAA family ATPase [Priestia taiwanensis]|uniref:Magnesium chelatase n=1 Tax=Priestia taiwanensis TaxID=1347902 RepID=A0A917AR71_9BACI|nr:MoxR family ATPase [Priestia taiwanensis]MBM7363172.1 MoxR-like ATPase [Priestia taiwanensis]GGE68280.1 magnesium chelatase [Priestia taiwanensis]
MELIQILRSNIGKIIIGKEEVINLVITSILSKGHVLLEDVPGTGKTLLAKTLAKSIGGSFRRIQFTPDILPSDITGIEFFNPKSIEFESRLGPLMANIVLADEINRAMPRTQASLLEAMEERQITIEATTHKLPDPFFVIATQNPIESQGTFPLPEAQLDRFFMKLSVGYPTFEEEKAMMNRFVTKEPYAELDAVVSVEDIHRLQEEVKYVKIHDAIQDYILQIVHRTRSHEYIEHGVSPRATLALMRGIQARAYMNNRTYCIPEDVLHLVPYVFSHRIVLSLEGSLRSNQEDMIQSILDEIDVPVEISK